MISLNCITRRCWCLTAVFFYAIVGYVIRRYRRTLRLAPRIWYGASPMVWEPFLVKGDQGLGYPSVSVVTTKVASNTPAAYKQFERIIDRDIAPDILHWKYLCDALRHADILQMYFQTPFGHELHLPFIKFSLNVLKLFGVKIVVRAQGGDVVYRSPQVTRFDWVGRMQADYPQWDLVEARLTRLPLIRLLSKKADLVLAADSALARLVPRNDIMFKYFPVDTEILSESPSTGSGTPLIVHAPNHRSVKGTDILLEAAERLRERGIDFEFKLIEGVSREAAWSQYRSADIIADQFCIGAYGAFACEALALGKPVVGYLDQEHLGNPAYNLPIVNANAHNLTEVLAALVTVPELRARLGRAGREAVERYQSIAAIAEVWDRIYQHLWWGKPLSIDDTIHFSSERRSRSFTEDPRSMDFWPVKVADLMPAICSVVDGLGAQNSMLVRSNLD